MALLLLDGFETYGSGGITGVNLETDLEQIWTDADGDTYSYITVPGRNGFGACLNLSPNGYSFVGKHFVGDPKQTWIIGFAVLLPTDSTYDDNWRYMYSAQSDVEASQITLRLGHTDSIGVWIGFWDGGAYLHQESLPGTFRTGVWNFVEFKYTIDATVGSYEVRVNGLTIMSGSGLDTDFSGDGDVAKHIFLNAKYNMKIDDVYICDDLGGSFDDFLGHQHTVLGLTPSADTAQLDWSAQPAGSHYANIDEDGGNDGTDYVYDSLAGNEDLYDYSDLPATIGDVMLVDIWTQAALSVAGSESLVLTCQSGATHSDGSTEAVTDTAYTTFHRRMLQDPNTAAAWTEAGFNAAQFGVKVG
jgi:hypothetical protein